MIAFMPLSSKDKHGQHNNLVGRSYFRHNRHIRVCDCLAVNHLFPFASQAIFLPFNDPSCHHALFDVENTQVVGFHFLIGMDAQDVLTRTNQLTHPEEHAFMH
jgi:hypothetical protein